MLESKGGSVGAGNWACCPEGVLGEGDLEVALKCRQAHRCGVHSWEQEPLVAATLLPRTRGKKQAG